MKIQFGIGIIILLAFSTVILSLDNMGENPRYGDTDNSFKIALEKITDPTDKWEDQSYNCLYSNQRLQEVILLGTDDAKFEEKFAKIQLNGGVFVLSRQKGELSNSKKKRVRYKGHGLELTLSLKEEKSCRACEGTIWRGVAKIQSEHKALEIPISGHCAN
jgi:hypothetical protein